MFVHPGQVPEVVKRHPEIAKACLVVVGSHRPGCYDLHDEVAGAGEGVNGGVKQSI
jgi:phenylacetate-CoA ligase